MTVTSRQGAAATVTLLCWLLIVFDGYDLIVYGTVLPALLEEPGWGMDPGLAGLIGSMAFVGMLLGALAAGFLTDRLGRRRTILACTVLFSVCTAFCGLATGPAMFGTFRLLAGLGLGGLVPAASALGAEFVPARYRPMVATLMMSGIPIGGSIAALVGIGVLPVGGWRPMFWIALLALVLVVPVCMARLPESPAWLRGRGRTAEAEIIEARYRVPREPEPGPTARTVTAAGPCELVRGPYLRPTVLFALATAATLFTWYGLGTWLPQLMRTAGFELGPALGFLLALNLGAVAGSVLAAAAAVRFGAANTAIGSCTLAAGGLLVLLTGPGTVLSYLALVLAGIGTHGTQCLIIAMVASRYPAAMRGSALGVALGIGRIGAVAAPQVGGLLLAAGMGVDANFLIFALAAAATGAVLLMIRRPVGESHPEGVPA